MKPILIAGALALTLSGCVSGSLGPLLSTVGVDPAKVTELEDKAIGHAIRPIPVYCGGTLTTREAFRERVNTHPGMGGAEIGIWCEGDPALTLGE